MTPDCSPLGSQPVQKQDTDHTGWILLVLCVILALFIFPKCLRARTQGQLARCKTNLKCLATALEMYSSDNGGSYPPRLGKLTSGKAYLWDVPTCPADPRAAYTYRVSSRPYSFSLRCEGIHHTQNPHYYSPECQLTDHP